MASRLISDLAPSLQEKCRLFLAACQERGIPAHITCTGRSEAEQAALFAQGREPLASVTAKRRACGLWAIIPADNERCVTWTMDSKHIIRFDPVTGKALNDARAFDVAIVKDRQFTWELKVDVNADGIPDYAEMGEIGESFGLVWGGRWRRPDYPHFEEPEP